MEYNSITTLNEIRERAPCREGWEKLLARLGKTKADDEPLSLLTILESNGLDDALWCLRAKSLERLSRHFHAWCAEQVLHLYEEKYPGDMRIRDQIAMLRNDAATEGERAAAWAAQAAAQDAAWAARDAAWDAAQAAAWAAAQAAAQDAAWAAQAAAWAAQAAAQAAAWAAQAAAQDAAWAARDAARDAQEAQLRKMIAA